MDRIVIGKGVSRSDVVLLRGGDNRAWDITVCSGASLKLVIVALPGWDGAIGCDIAVQFEGEGGDCLLKGLYLAGGAANVNIKVNIVHNYPNCTSRQLFKGIVSGQARTGFSGLIKVPERCIGTEAYQENHNLLLSDDCRAQSLPQLEIYADDVKCSHGATFGRLGDEELFYMRSRGIPESEARKLQMIAFASEVLADIPEDIVSQALTSLEKLI